MEPAGVPALLAYRRGDKFAGLVPIIQDIPDDAELSASTLEFVLKRYQSNSNPIHSCVDKSTDPIPHARNHILR